MNRFIVGCIAVASLVGARVQAEPATGFFHVAQIEGRWVLIDPAGKPFISTGVTTVGFYQDHIQHTEVSPYGESNKAKYGDVMTWRKAVAGRLVGWSFNTLGCWSDDGIAKIDVGGKHLAYTSILNFGSGYDKYRKRDGAQKSIFPDVFEPEFVVHCQEEAQKVCLPRKDDPNLLGWFTDNEMRWGPDWRGKEELLVIFLNLPDQQAGRRAALDLLKGRYPDVAQFNAIWGTDFKSWDEAARAPSFATPPGMDRKALTAQNAEVKRSVSGQAGQAFIADCDAFLTLLADRYFQSARDAILAVDPNHMVMGCRFAIVPGQPVIDSAGKHLDLISLNNYSFDPTEALNAYASQNKPLIIGEFAFRGRDSGLPNTHGAGPIVLTQEDRARCFEKYVRVALRHPNLVGYHWFEHADEPKEGRFDGEDSNYGVVDIKDNPYEVLVKRMTEINGKALELHLHPSP